MNNKIIDKIKYVFLLIIKIKIKKMYFMIYSIMNIYNQSFNYQNPESFKF